MNIDLLTKTAEWLEAGAPERVFDMNTTLLPQQNDPENWCGSTCCIAGYVTTTFGTGHMKRSAIVKRDVLENAEKLLGLTEEFADHLFFPNYNRDRYDLCWEKITPETAAKVVRNLIATGKVDWTGPISEQVNLTVPA